MKIFERRRPNPERRSLYFYGRHFRLRAKKRPRAAPNPLKLESKNPRNSPSSLIFSCRAPRHKG